MTRYCCNKIHSFTQIKPSTILQVSGRLKWTHGCHLICIRNDRSDRRLSSVYTKISWYSSVNLRVNVLEIRCPKYMDTRTTFDTPLSSSCLKIINIHVLYNDDYSVSLLTISSWCPNVSMISSWTYFLFLIHKW